MLLCVLLVLLFGIFSQLPSPVMDNPPSGVTVINYSAFVQQVKARNVRTVTMQGDELTGVLVHPLQGGVCVAPPTNTISNPFAPTPSSPPGAPACAMYARMPASGDAALLPLLHSSGVVIRVLPARQPPVWLNLLLRVAPILLLLFLLLSLPPRKGMFSLHTMDEKITQFARSRARRFEPAPRQRNPRPVSWPWPVQPSQPPPPAGPRKQLPPSVTFADVAGIDEVRADLEEARAAAAHPSTLRSFGGAHPTWGLARRPTWNGEDAAGQSPSW